MELGVVVSGFLAIALALVGIERRLSRNIAEFEKHLVWLHEKMDDIGKLREDLAQEGYLRMIRRREDEGEHYLPRGV